VKKREGYQAEYYLQVLPRNHMSPQKCHLRATDKVCEKKNLESPALRLSEPLRLLAEKNNDIMKFAGKWMELENVILSEDKYSVHFPPHLLQLQEGSMGRKFPDIREKDAQKPSPDNNSRKF
ncbi:hypothetical protein STEG23_014368, partial [Scotinomys teguina]